MLEVTSRQADSIQLGKSGISRIVGTVLGESSRATCIHEAESCIHLHTKAAT
jgi:hypothetical protein